VTVIKPAIIFLLNHVSKGIWSKTEKRKETAERGRKAKVA